MKPSAVLLSATKLAGCAAFRGAPDPITPEQVDSDACPTTTDLKDFKAPAPNLQDGSMKQWRNLLIGECIAHYDANFATFIRQLHVQAVSTGLGLDLAALALTGAGSVASAGAANALSAASTGVLGASTAINKDLFYQKTLPAIEAAMAANRAQVYARIKTAEQGDETHYTLEDARHDLRDYEAAGSIDGAIAHITANAKQTEAASNAEVKALFVVPIVEQATQARKAALAKYIKSLKLPADKKTLDAIAKALGASSNVNLSIERGNVLVKIDQTVVDPKSMDTTSAALKPITKKDF